MPTEYPMLAHTIGGRLPGLCNGLLHNWGQEALRFCPLLSNAVTNLSHFFMPARFSGM